MGRLNCWARLRPLSLSDSATIFSDSIIQLQQIFEHNSINISIHSKYMISISSISSVLYLFFLLSHFKVLCPSILYLFPMYNDKHVTNNCRWTIATRLPIFQSSSRRRRPWIKLGSQKGRLWREIPSPKSSIIKSLTLRRLVLVTSAA